MKPKYKYSSPHDWLESRIASLADSVTGNGAAELLSIVRNLALRLDSDQIQDDFQSDMEADGYFKPIDSESTDEDEEETHGQD